MKEFQKQKKNHISCNEQEQTGSERNRQNYISDIEKILHHKEIHISARKSRSKEQTGTDRNRQE
jgi:adenine C2-methylase RlmN of 23S rRNA A2503 and tRNA A37